MANIALDVGVFLFIISLFLFFKRHRNASRLPLPPGPKKRPIIGNLLDMPKGFEWITYHRWCQELGSDIIHLDIAGTSIIILDNAQVATELLEKRSSIYSDRELAVFNPLHDLSSLTTFYRAWMPMIHELMGWDFLVAWMPYGDAWRRRRRLLHQEFNHIAAKRFRPHELKATHGLLRRLLESRNDLLGNLRHMAGETIMSLTYGLEIQSKNDPYITTAAAATHSAFTAAVPGTFLVDSLPMLKYVPDWMPFADFKRKARHWRKLALDMINKPYAVAKKNIENGDTTPSFTFSSLQKMGASSNVKLQETVIKSVAGTMYTAGSDTTVSAIASCILGLLENPVALKKGQEEIDRIVGPDRLPSFDDEDSLPYITAIVKETLRWRNVTPIAIPHLLNADDEYDGYWLPKGSTVIPNVWAMLHDEKVYPRPFDFNPDRFIKDGKLDPNVKDPKHVAFGFGRRICSGRHMAFSAVWITVASILATYNITKARNENGQVIEPSHEYLSAIVCVPLPFECSITPRSHQAEALIEATVYEERKEGPDHEGI